jgi:predicted ATPase
MRTGAYGSSSMRSYGMMGDKVNLAARLMQAATNGILCDENVFQAVQGSLEMAALPPIKVKGKDDWIPIFRPAGEKQPDSRRKVAITGRAEEQSILQRGLENLQAGQGGVILLEGEAGLGKTRLLETLAEWASERGLQVIRGGASTVQARSFSAVWRGIAFQALGLNSLPDSPARIERIQALARDVEELPQASLINHFLGLTFSEERTAEVEPDRTLRTIELLASLLIAAAKQSPLVILLDEAEDLDPLFWKMALALGGQEAPVLQAIGARPLPLPLPEAYLQLFLQPATQRLNLAPLSPAETLSLACQCLDVDNLTEPVQALFGGPSGNPYFILETADLLREAGILEIRDRQASLAPEVDLDSIQIPGSMQGMVASRLDRLTLEERLVLKVASVIGRRFPLPLLQVIYPVKEGKERLEELLQSLEWQDLVTATGEGRWYRFNQPVTLEFAYSSMLFSQRRQLHRQVAEWYEEHSGEEGSCPSQELSEHWLKAGEPMKALRYLEKAGQEALERGDFAEAERIFQACLDLESKSAVLEEGDLGGHIIEPPLRKGS